MKKKPSTEKGLLKQLEKVIGKITTITETKTYTLKPKKGKKDEKTS